MKSLVHKTVCNIESDTVRSFKVKVTVKMEDVWHYPSWEANSRLANQEIPLHLRNPKVHYRVHNRPQLTLSFLRSL